MLGRIGNYAITDAPPINCVNEDRYKRDEMEDMKTAIEYLYEFKKKLSKLHPSICGSIESMLQLNNRY